MDCVGLEFFPGQKIMANKRLIRVIEYFSGGLTIGFMMVYVQRSYGSDPQLPQVLLCFSFCNFVTLISCELELFICLGIMGCLDKFFYEFF